MHITSRSKRFATSSSVAHTSIILHHYERASLNHHATSCSSGMFHPSDFSEESFSDELEGDVASECGKCGQIEKITVFSKNPKGVVIVKFTTSYASQQCVKLMDGRFFGGKKLRCFFWDGATDFTGESASSYCFLLLPFLYFLLLSCVTDGGHLHEHVTSLGRDGSVSLCAAVVVDSSTRTSEFPTRLQSLYSIRKDLK